MLALYAVVLHDFVAERSDELEAKAGDSIMVVAYSNRDWFVAESIVRLGKPGLIPVSFVEFRDPPTGGLKRIPGICAPMNNGTLPHVDDWKKQYHRLRLSQQLNPDFRLPPFRSCIIRYEIRHPLARANLSFASRN